ncbi:MAG: C1 family peptidase [Planctomycetia bacterium]|nr:C1 family peptidase [Planctomycetia bacterium]
MRLERHYGWRRDLPDARDYRFSPPVPKAVLPRRVDLRDQFPNPCFDQGPLGSCTAFMCKSLVEFAQVKQKVAVSDPAALYMYYNARVIEGTTDWDSGASIRNAIKAVNAQGACHESEWPYETRRFAECPPHVAYLSGKEHQALTYARVDQRLIAMKRHLAEGWPFGIGFSVYDNFEELDDRGVLDMPDLATMSVLGGHAVVVCGYDDDQSDGEFIIRNSYGPDWGRRGYFRMPYAYLTNSDLADDFWSITLMEA